MFKLRGWTEKAWMLNLMLAMLLIQEFTILSCVFPGSDIASIATVSIPAIFVEVGVFSSFIVWKNKEENCRKHGSRLEE